MPDNNERKLRLCIADEALKYFKQYLLNKAKNNPFKDKKIIHIINKHFFNNKKVEKDFDVNNFILKYLSDNKIPIQDYEKKFLYKFLYAIQDLKLNTTCILSVNKQQEDKKYKNKNGIIEYQHGNYYKWSEEVLELLEYGQLCVRIGKNCIARVNKIEDIRSKKKDDHKEERIINIIDCNNYFNQDNCFKMDERIQWLNYNNFYRNISSAIFNAIFYEHNNDKKNKTIHIVIPSIHSWGGKNSKEINENIIDNYFSSYKALFKNKETKLNIQCHLRMSSQQFNNYLKKKSKEEQEEIKKIFTIDMDYYKNTNPFPSNDEENEWYWISCGDHLVKFGNDMLSHLNEDDKKLNDAFLTDEYFNIRINYFKYLGINDLWGKTTEEQFNDKYYCKFNPEKLNMPIDNFVFEDKYNSNDFNVKNYQNDEDIYSKLQQENEKDLKITQLAKIYLENKDPLPHFFEIKNDKNNNYKTSKFKNAVGCYSWWAFPSSSSSNSAYDFDNDDIIYKNIANSARYINDYIVFLNWLCDTINLDQEIPGCLNHVDFTKILQCYTRIYSAIMQIPKNQLNESQKLFINKYNERFVPLLEKKVKNEKIDINQLNDKKNPYPLYDCGNEKYNEDNKKLFLHITGLEIQLDKTDNKNNKEKEQIDNKINEKKNYKEDNIKQDKKNKSNHSVEDNIKNTNKFNKKYHYTESDNEEKNNYSDINNKNKKININKIEKKYKEDKEGDNKIDSKINQEQQSSLFTDNKQQDQIDGKIIDNDTNERQNEILNRNNDKNNIQKNIDNNNSQIIDYHYNGSDNTLTNSNNTTTISLSNKKFQNTEIKKKEIKNQQPNPISNEQSINNNNISYKKLLKWTTNDIICAVLLCILCIIAGIIYIVNKNNSLKEQNQQIEQYNKKVHSIKNINNNYSLNQNNLSIN